MSGTGAMDPDAVAAAAAAEDAAAASGGEPRIAPDPTAAAFFDVDNTMMQGASIYHFARGLAARNYFTTGDLVRFGWPQLRFLMLASENPGHMSEATQTALAFVAGWLVEDLERLSNEIFDERLADRILSVPVFPELSPDSVERVANALMAFGQ